MKEEQKCWEGSGPAPVRLFRYSKLLNFRPVSVCYCPLADLKTDLTRPGSFPYLALSTIL